MYLIWIMKSRFRSECKKFACKEEQTLLENTNFYLDLDDGAMSASNVSTAEFGRQLELAHKHPLIAEYIAYIRHEEGLDKDDWTFGYEDPGEDLKNFIEWLKHKGLTLEGHSAPVGSSIQDRIGPEPEVNPNAFLASVARVLCWNVNKFCLT